MLVNYNLTAPPDPGVSRVIAECAESRWTMGPRVEQFEDALAAKVGSRYAVMFNSGSSANLAMVAALYYTGELSRTSLIAAPVLAWSTTYSPFALFGMPLDIYGVDDTFCWSGPPKRMPHLSMVVHALGNAADTDKGSVVIEDACEAFGSHFDDGRWVGTAGAMGSYSFYYSHHTHTIEGGAVVTDVPKLARVLRQFREHGWNRAPGETTFHFEIPGMNLRPTDIQGALGLYQLGRLDADLEVRLRNREKYERRFGDTFIRWTEGAVPFAFPFRGNAEQIAELEAQGLQTRTVIGGNIWRHRMSAHLNLTSQTSQDKVNDIHDNFFMTGNPAVEIPDEAFAAIEEQLL